MYWQPYLAFGKGNKVNNDELMFWKERFLLTALGENWFILQAGEGRQQKTG